MQHLTTLLAAAAFALITTPADADLGDQLFKLLPNDGAAADIFGSAVAISDDTAIVGARFDDDSGAESGSAYLYNTNSGLQIFKFLPNDGAAGDQFGISVAISGAIAIVGAYLDDDNGIGSGSAYLFNTEIDAGGGPLAKLLPDDGAASDRFGRSVAIDGASVIVGAYLDNDNGSASGSAYAFDISDPASPIQIAKLLPADGAVQDNFGRSIAISGTTAIVGAHQNDDNGSNSGSAYLFDIATGRQIAKLLPDDGASGDQFGWSVAISGSIAIVAAVWDDDNGAGSAYFFDISDRANPVQIAKLLPDDGAAGDQFGWAVAISGATAIVGAVWDDDNGADSGSAYFFDAAPPAPCLSDLDADGMVDAADLAMLLGSWGPCRGCPADLDGDGNVGANDLAALLSNWGPCV